MAEAPFNLESQVVGVVDKPASTPPEYKYLEVDVTREEATFVYLKVPRNFKNERVFRAHKMLGKACEETADEGDWDNSGWQESISAHAVKEVPESEATKYSIFEVSHEDSERLCK